MNRFILIIGYTPLSKSIYSTLIIMNHLRRLNSDNSSIHAAVNPRLVTLLNEGVYTA